MVYSDFTSLLTQCYWCLTKVFLVRGNSIHTVNKNKNGRTELQIRSIEDNAKINFLISQ